MATSESTFCPRSSSWKLPDGRYHRVDGPAKTLASGSERWMLWDKFHRVDGPAVNDTYQDISLWYVHGYIVDVEEKRAGTLDSYREKLNTNMLVHYLQTIDFGDAYQSIPDLLYIKDNADVDTLQHPNVNVAAIAAWNVNVDDRYVSAAFDNPFVMNFMRARTDIPEHVRTLLRVAA